MKFILFHGSFASAEGNWFPELREKLEAVGQIVITLQFPVDSWNEFTKAGLKASSKNQSLVRWTEKFQKETLNKIKKEKKLCFIGHSLGCLFILHILDKFNIRLDSAIFVSPFLEKLNRFWQIDKVNETFYEKKLDFEKIKKLIPISYVLYSDNDPYVNQKYSIDFAKKVNSSIIFVKRAGHMNSEVNLNEFPLVYELCKTRLNLSLYQKYLAHRRELYAVNYIKTRSEEIVYLKPEEVFDEGLFHFRNLKKQGFCTFFTALKFWDTQSKYMEEARRAAKRIKDLTRVFVVNNLSDLKRPNLLKQIRLDLSAGIKVYLCVFEDIRGGVAEPDFGIWDNDYLCVVHFDKKKTVSEAILNSRKLDIKKALEWKKIILKKAKRIYNAGRDIRYFIKTYNKN